MWTALRMVVRQMSGTPLDEQIPRPVIDRLEELDALRETAMDVMDMATDRMNAAPAALCDAARQLAEAEEERTKGRGSFLPELSHS